MDIVHFFETYREFLALEIWTFPGTPPQYFVLTTKDGAQHFIYSTIVELGKRAEAGVLAMSDEIRKFSPDVEKQRIHSAASLLSFRPLADPASAGISALEMRFDVGVLLATAGDMPYSISVMFGGKQWGTPGYPINEYRSLSG